jgi:hypothetical protein
MYGTDPLVHRIRLAFSVAGTLAWWFLAPDRTGPIFFGGIVVLIVLTLLFTALVQHVVNSYRERASRKHDAASKKRAGCQAAASKQPAEYQAAASNRTAGNQDAAGKQPAGLQDADKRQAAGTQDVDRRHATEHQDAE